MAHEVHLRVVVIARFEVVPEELRAVDHFPNERVELSLYVLEPHPPVITEGIDGYGLVLPRAQVIAELLD
jgi:hypothetical protein